MNSANPSLSSGSETALIGHALGLNELFSTWPAESRSPLLRVARVGPYQRGNNVLAHDRHARELLAVVSGCLEISGTSTDGRKYLHALMRPSTVAPLTRLLEDVPEPLDYLAHEDSLIIHLPADAVIAQLDLRPELWRGVASLALQRQRYSVAHLSRQLLSSLDRRLAAMLQTLGLLYGQLEPQGLSLQVRLSQNDLAAMLGVSRQTMNRALGQMIDSGVIQTCYNRITILDMPALQRLAESR